MSAQRRHGKTRAWNTGKAAEELVTSRGLSVASFADAMKFSRATAYNRFRAAEWEWPEVVRASGILGVQTAWLDNGEGEKLAPYAADRVNSPEIQKAISDIMMEMRGRLLEFAEVVAASSIQQHGPKRGDVRLFQD